MHLGHLMHPMRPMIKAPLYNFSPGPAMLPAPVLATIKTDLAQTSAGNTFLELSHRSPQVIEMAEQAEADLRSLLNIPESFAILCLQGGARQQFGVLPLNLFYQESVVDYLVSGYWSAMAATAAAKAVTTQIVFDTAQQSVTQLMDTAWQYHPQARFLHYTDNETIEGVELPKLTVPNKLLVADMTSSLLTKPIDWPAYAAIYAGTQKNLGIAGLTLVILRKNLIGPGHPLLPDTLNYQIQAQAQSMYNTPPVFNWYVMGLVLKWAKQQGGIRVLAQAAKARAKLVYQCIDNSALYHNALPLPLRSRLNIPFTLTKPKLESLFLQQAQQNGLISLRGHPKVGGIRASLYNAMPYAGAVALVDFMQDFEIQHAQ